LQGSGTLIITKDGGKHWAYASIISSPGFSAYFFISAHLCYLVGSSGISYKVILGNATYNWQPAGGLSDPNIDSPIAKPDTTTYYKLTITPDSSMGCGIFTDSVLVNVIQVSVTANSSQINCADSTQLQAIVNFNNGNFTYNWLPTAGLSNPDIQNPKASPESNTIYTVTVHPNNGCNEPQAMSNLTVNLPGVNNICRVSVEDNKNIVFWSKEVSYIIDSFYVYRETNISNVFEKIGGTAYNDSSIFIDSLSNPYAQSRRYCITVTDMCKHSSGLSPAHKTIHLIIYQPTGNTWNLVWEPYEGFSVSTYRIYRGTSANQLNLIGTTPASSTQFTDVNVPAGNIYYLVQAENADSCNPDISGNLSNSNIATNDMTGIAILLDSEKIKIHPNPASDIIFVDGLSENARVSIFTIDGKKLFMTNQNTNPIDIRSLSKGMYFIKFETVNGNIIKKFVKE
jgi:hypothetical protein